MVQGGYRKSKGNISAPNSTYPVPDKFNSDIILPNDGSFIQKFRKVGIYDYYDKMNAMAVGRIKFGDQGFDNKVI